MRLWRWRRVLLRIRDAWEDVMNECKLWEGYDMVVEIWRLGIRKGELSA